MKLRSLNLEMSIAQSCIVVNIFLKKSFDNCKRIWELQVLHGLSWRDIVNLVEAGQRRSLRLPARVAGLLAVRKGHLPIFVKIKGPSL